METSPNAEVYLDDQFAGRASPEGRRVIANPKPGDHALRISLTGKQDYEQKVSVVAGQVTKITPALADLAGKFLFEGQSDVGEHLREGSAEFDSARGEYRVTGSGANMWNNADAFHYVWRRMSGDLTLTADLKLEGRGSQPHRKAGWVVRQGLEPDSPYVSAVVHGDGLASLQYREVQGGPTLEVRSMITAPPAIRLVRHGNTFTFWAARHGEALGEAGETTVLLHDPLYVGLAVCAHDPEQLEEAVFTGVRISNQALVPTREPAVESRLEIVSVDGQERRVVYRAPRLFEAPNWSRDGKHLLFNSGGRIYTLPINGGEPRLLNTGIATHCNNDHGISPDGKLLAISNSPQDKSLIYVLPLAGGEPRQVTSLGPSYWHGWSPDGKTLAYCAERGGNFDVYTISVDGGEEKRLTDAPGLDDGPDYSPDGRFIYFNSERTGLMQIWRMKPDGSGQEQVTNDGYADWFAHPSPDGKWLVFLSFARSAKGHPPNKQVALRLMPSAAGQPRILVELFGGQGTINVPSWSPDSKYLAFVSYAVDEHGGTPPAP
jgi:Tol biopolymer transport system component